MIKKYASPTIALALVLFPSISLFGKNIFFIELITFGLLIYSLASIQRQTNIEFPAELKLVLLAAAIPYIAGMFRQETTGQMLIYKYYEARDDTFSLTQDTIRWLRFTLLFCTPWLISNFIKNEMSQSKFMDSFLKYLVYATAISGVISLIVKFRILNLSFIGLGMKNMEWENRAFGTFTSPQEAGLFFGGIFILLTLDLFHKKQIPSPLEVMSLILIFAGLFSTKTATAFIGVFVTLGVFVFLKTKRQIRILLCIFLTIGLLVALTFTSGSLVIWKFNNLTIRTFIFSQWFETLQQKPIFLITGIGYSSIVTDSSFLFFIIKGGVALTAAIIIWLRFLLKKSGPFFYFYLYWFCTWLALDSFGFWGIGRLAWILLGVQYAERSNKLRTHKV